MNLVTLQERIKDLSEQQLVTEMQRPSGQVPQFLLLTELNRRKRMMDQHQLDQAQGDRQTVARDLMAVAGLPALQAGHMASTMAPQTNMAGNTGAVQAPTPQAPQARAPVMMREGGIVALQEGGRVGGRPQLVVMNGRQFARMSDGSLIPMESLGFPTDDLRPQDGARTPMTVMDAPVNPSYSEDRLFVSPTPRMPMLDVPGAAPTTRYDRAMLELQDIAGQERPPSFGISSLPTVLGLPGTSMAAVPDASSMGTPPLASLLSGSVPDPSVVRRPFVDPNAAPYSTLTNLLFPADSPAAQAELEAQDTGGAFLPGSAAAAQARNAALAAEQAAQTTAAEPTEPTSPVTPAAPVAPTAPASAAPGSGGAGGAGAGGAGAGGVGGAGSVSASAAPGSFEELIQQRIEGAEAERRRDQWLTLAQFGLQLMASERPTLGGAVGEAGAQALQSLRGSYDDYNNTMMELYGVRDQLADRREAQAARAAGRAAGTGSPTAPSFGLSTDQERLLELYGGQIARLDAALANPMGVDPAAQLDLSNQRDVLYTQMQAIMGAMTGLPFGVTGDATAPSFDVR